LLLLEDSPIIIEHTDLPECETTEPIDILPTTSTDDSMSNNVQSSFKQLLPKILSNKSLSITLQPNFNNSIHITEREFNKVDEPTVVLLPSTNIKYKPNNDEDDDDDDDDVHSIASSNDCIITDSFQSSLRQIRSKTSAKSSHSISITLESSNKQNGQISTIESTKDNHIDVLKSTLKLNTEPTDILSTISANCSLTNSSQSSIDELLSKTLSNNSLSITLEPNTSKKSKTLPDSDSINVINSTTAISKSVGLTNDTFPTIVITDDDDEEDNDDDSISESDYSQSHFEKLPPKTSANSSLTMTLNQKKKQSKQISAIECNEVINPTVILKPTLKQNAEHIDILPLTSVGSSTLPSCLKKMLSKNTGNNSLSITLKPNHDNVATTSTNGYMSKTVQSNSKQSEKEYATTFNVSSNSETPKSSEMNTHCLICNAHFFHTDQMCIGNKEVVKFNNVLSIIKIARNILFPNFLWKCLYNIGFKKILFIQRDCMKGPVKKILFYSGLIPNIKINGKIYEYNIAVNTKNELEDLLEKIDDIDICFGLDGYTHDQCIGYYDNPSGENEACERCNSLLQDGYLSRMDIMLKNKLLKIKNLENRVSRSCFSKHFIIKCILFKFFSLDC